MVVGSESPEDLEFAEAFAIAWKLAGVKTPEDRIWIGTPQEIRRKIQSQGSGPLELILAPGARSWVLFEDIQQTFPDRRLSLRVVIENGMNLMQLDSYAQKVVFGGIILFAVLIDRLRHKA